MKNNILTIALALAMCANITQAKDVSFETMSQAVGILITKVTDIENELAENGNEKSDMDSKVKLLQEQVASMQKQINTIAEKQTASANIAHSSVNKDLVATPKQQDEESLSNNEYSISTNLRIYKEANTASRKLGIYNAGTIVKISEIKNDMALTPRGWVSFIFLEKQGKQNENK